MAYKDVAMTRKEMAKTLTGEKRKIKQQTPGSPEISGHGDVFAPINKAFRKKEAEERAMEERKQKLRDAQFEAADWRM
jgi:hypothetical protein